MAKTFLHLEDAHSNAFRAIAYIYLSLELTLWPWSWYFIHCNFIL